MKVHKVDLPIGQWMVDNSAFYHFKSTTKPKLDETFLIKCLKLLSLSLHHYSTLKALVELLWKFLGIRQLSNINPRWSP